MKAILLGLLAMSISWNVNASEGGMKDKASNFGFQKRKPAWKARSRKRG